MKKWSWLIVLLLTISIIPLPSKAGELSDRLQGYILLQVEENGEAWYVRKDTGKRIYMSDGEVAYNMMRLLGLGITNTDLDKIPVGFLDQYEFPDIDGDGLHNTLESGVGTDKNDPDTDGDGYQDGTEVRNGFSPLGPGRYEYDQGLIDRVRGRILLQVERSGEAWYVNPVDGKRYYMPDGFSAFQIMRFLSLGITNSDLDQILIDTDFTLPEEHESTWQKSAIVDLDALPFDPAIGDLTGEGWNYLYVPQSLTGSDLTEVDYIDAWSDSALGTIGGDPRFTAIGEIRSDKGLYISNTTGTITEVTILNGIVTFDDIDPGNLQVWGLDIGDGRNDGINRLYAMKHDGNLYEYSYISGEWEIQIALTMSGTSAPWDLIVGNGRNDGVVRIYVTSFDNKVHEFSYIGGNWSEEIIGETSSYTEGITIGDGNNDGNNEVYAASNDKHVYEFSYQDGSWNETDLGAGGDSMWDVEVGAVKGDSINRVYAVSQDKKLYEFTKSDSGWSQETVGEFTDTVSRLTIGVVGGREQSAIYISSNDKKVYEYAYE